MGVRGVLFDGAGTVWRAPTDTMLSGHEGSGAELVLFEEAEQALGAVARRFPVGLVTDSVGASSLPIRDHVDFVLDVETVGVDKTDSRFFTMASAGLGCHPNEIVTVGDDPVADVVATQRVGGRGIWLNRTGEACPRGVHPDAVIADLAELARVLDQFLDDDHAASFTNGVGPHPQPWPDDDHLDPALLAEGDRRNVIDPYRYWSESAIIEDLRRRGHTFHVAVENWRRDRNIGTVVRNANGFGAAGIHIVGPRRWNRRGAMATDRYLSVTQYATVDEFVDWAHAEKLVIVAVDNVDGAEPIETATLPERCVLVFGQEGPGLTSTVLEHADVVVGITQYGSTRSLNAGVAAGIAMYEWVRRHAR